MVASQLRLPRLPNCYLQLRHGGCTQVYERGEGTPVIVLPGLAGGVALIEPLLEHLAKHHRVITFELRGESDAFPTRHFPFEQHVDDLQTVLDDLKLERPAMFGFSFGAAVALEYAVANPHRLSWLAVQGSGSHFEAGVMAHAVRRVLQRLRLPTDSQFLNQFVNVLLGCRPTAGTDLDSIVGSIWSTEQATMAHRLEQLDEFDVTDRLWNLHTPTLVLGGERDLVTPPADLRDLARQIPSAEFHLIPEAGHLASITHPNLVTQAVRAFQQTVQYA